MDMSKETKPTSKVIQISETAGQGRLWLTALCKDGSIWNRADEWMCILEPHKEPVEEE